MDDHKFYLPKTCISESNTDRRIPIAGSFPAAKNKTSDQIFIFLECVKCKNVKKRSTAEAAKAAMPPAIGILRSVKLYE